MAESRTLHVPEGTFGLTDAGELPIHTADWSNSLCAPMDQGALICTGIHTGNVLVATEALAMPPDLPVDPRWEEVVEVSVQSPLGSLYLDSMSTGLITNLGLMSSSGPGSYRLRVHARGRGTLPDKVSDDPVEEYLLSIWPAPPSSPTVLVSSDRIDRALASAAAASRQRPKTDAAPHVREPKPIAKPSTWPHQ